MSVSSVGGDASQLWQILKESRTKQAAGGSGGSSVASFGLDAADASASGTASAGQSPSASAGPSNAATKIISDLRSLLLGLQSDGDPAPTGGTMTAATSTAANAPTDMQSSLRSLLGDMGQVKGHGGMHHHAHGQHTGASPSGADGSQAQPRVQADLLSTIANGLKAYGAQASSAAATPTTTLSA